MINRLIFWLSLVGMVLALHLWVQKARGFDQGCLGLATHTQAAMPMAPAEEGCREVGRLPASHLFGVSNAAWGYAFYFALALLAFGKVVVRPDWARRLHGMGEVLVAGALLYSAYLVYQMGFVAQAWCVLCLMSASLVTVLAGLHALLRVRGGFRPVDEAQRGRELGLATGGMFAMSGLLVGVLLFVDRLGTRPLDEGETGRQLRAVVGQSLPFYIDGEKLRQMRACRIDWSQPELKLAQFVGAETPFIGDAAELRVVLFVDPNCPHCAEYFPGFMEAARESEARAGFTVVPRVLWDESVPQAAALKLAEGSGKYFELWRAMFANQPGPRQGLTVAQIAALFREFGLETKDLEQRIAATIPTIEAQRRAARAGGIDHVPAVYLEGRPVWGENQTPECLGRLVERVRAGLVKVR